MMVCNERKLSAIQVVHEMGHTPYNGERLPLIARVVGFSLVVTSVSIGHNILIPLTVLLVKDCLEARFSPICVQLKRSVKIRCLDDGRRR